MVITTDIGSRTLPCYRFRVVFVCDFLDDEGRHFQKGTSIVFYGDLCDFKVHPYINFVKLQQVDQIGKNYLANCVKREKRKQRREKERQ